MNVNRVRRPPGAAEPRPARVVLVAVALLAVLAAGCGVPRDPEGTLDTVRGGTLRAGITASEPWTTLEGGRPVPEIRRPEPAGEDA